MSNPLDMGALVNYTCSMTSNRGPWNYLARQVARGAVSEDGEDGGLRNVRARTRLLFLLDLRRSVDEEIDQAVVTAREHGATWQQIGKALYITRQGAQHRYRRALMNRGLPDPHAAERTRRSFPVD
jgi:hypothetical protein